VQISRKYSAVAEFASSVGGAALVNYNAGFQGKEVLMQNSFASFRVLGVFGEMGVTKGTKAHEGNL
jgi:hypothetical protein